MELLAKFIGSLVGALYLALDFFMIVICLSMSIYLIGTGSPVFGVFSGIFCYCLWSAFTFVLEDWLELKRKELE